MTEKYRVILSPRALADLMEAYAFIASDSPDHAAELVARILRSLDLLEIIPQRFILQQKKPGAYAIRTLPVKPYIVYFRLVDSEQTIRVLTIRHAARRRPRRFE